MKLLEGALMPDDDGSVEVSPADGHDLREEIRDLREQLSETHRELAEMKRASTAALGNLRKLLKPWYQALQMIYGELETVDEDAAPSSPRTSAVWEAWKSRLPGRPAQIIDALLLHGELNTSQLGVAVGMSRSNVPAVMTRLKQAGIIQKNGDKFSLKKLG